MNVPSVAGRALRAAPLGSALLGSALLAAACATPSPSSDATLLPAALREAMVTPEMGSPHAGDPAPAFELQQLGGGRVRLEELRGKPVLLHFTATWCPYCREEIAAIAAIAAEVGEGATVVLVDVKEGEERWRAFGALERRPCATGPLVLFDDDGAVSARYAPPRARPYLQRDEVPLAGTMLIDDEGVVQLYVLADNEKFDPTLADLRAQFLSLMAPDAPAVAGRSPQDVVPTISPRVAPVEVAAGGHTVVELCATVPHGVHIMSNAPPEPELIPTAVTTDAADLEVQALEWPTAVPYRVGERELPTFLGDVRIGIPLRVPADAAPGLRTLTGTLRYQACTHSRCFMPRTATFSVAVTVTAGHS